MSILTSSTPRWSTANLTLSGSMHRELSSGLGFHTYISWASEGDRWNVTSYLNPEVNHPCRITHP